MAIFQGRDRAANDIDFVASGTNSALIVGVGAITPVPIVLGFEKRMISTSSIGITASTIPTGATHALVTLEGGDCRFRDDANAVTGTDGLLMIAGQAFEFTNLADLRFIRTSYEAADVTLQISYRKYG